ncbi:KGK domain-containing protein [Synechococcus sp. PCC 6312]|uniref:KGK domain-containing protein n=1 Tax=Synechococcus sp. (strain ATCC 27167 / PCC 6312) TaxID=195253 RepID=UPI00029EF986|nr:KGK domain-containing protein [Synechococcus sp. PCC 6312]AFY61215.1 KGK domain protein [Synechococcus sp. PCC 6312]
MESEFCPVNNDLSVISFKTGTFKLIDLIEMLTKFGKDWNSSISEQIGAQGKGNIPQKFLFEGVEAELLEPGQLKWIKGKARIKITLEFASDSSFPPKVTESSMLNLDEIRKMSVE